MSEGPVGEGGGGGGGPERVRSALCSYDFHSAAPPAGLCVMAPSDALLLTAVTCVVCMPSWRAGKAEVDPVP